MSKPYNWGPIRPLTKPLTESLEHGTSAPKVEGYSGTNHTEFAGRSISASNAHANAKASGRPALNTSEPPPKLSLFGGRRRRSKKNRRTKLRGTKKNKTVRRR